MNWKIGDVPISGRAVLGPMQGYSCAAYREFTAPYGVSLAVTEMVSDKGLIHAHPKTVPYARFEHSVPTALQLFGSDPEELQSAAGKALSYNPTIDMIDVNMGCPVPKVTRNGSGSALMRDPAKCGRIIRRIKGKVDVPVTQKIRLGWNRGEMNFADVIGELEAQDVDCIALHARTAADKYAGAPDYQQVRGLRKDMSVPLIISGNIYCLDDAVRAQECTGAEGIMISRGGVGNPFLISQIRAWFDRGERLPEPTVSEQVDRCICFSRMLVEEKGEEVAVRKLRSYAPRFISGCIGGRAYRNRLATETWDLVHMYSILEEIRTDLGDQRIEPSVGLDFRP